MKKGFTLIELLVVVAIISLLTSVIMASMASSKQKAQNSKVLQEKRSIELAVQLMISSSGNYPYPGNGSWHCLASTNCVIGGIVYTPSSAGGLAIFKKEEREPLALIKTAHALFSGNLATRPSATPTVAPTGTNYSGPLYQCTSISGSTCTAARLLWTVHGPSCPNASVLTGSARASVCISDAAGGGPVSIY
jgi:prepilin-type N-terminal cleavage/methylation domain-containing protein